MAGSFRGQASLGPGIRIAGYVLEEQVGAGGMAIVFRARDEVLGRLAALKVLAPALANDPEFRARFLRESRAVATVDEPHIVPIYAAGEASGVLYIATRFVATDGGVIANYVTNFHGVSKAYLWNTGTRTHIATVALPDGAFISVGPQGKDINTPWPGQLLFFNAA